jgi:hypothetical protein
MRRLILCCLLLIGALRAADWTTFRGDPRRSGVAAEPLALPLAKSWTFAPVQAPAPAWPGPAAINYAVMHGPLQQTLTFDRAFHVVADGEQSTFRRGSFPRAASSFARWTNRAARRSSSVF